MSNEFVSDEFKLNYFDSLSTIKNMFACSLLLCDCWAAAAAMSYGLLHCETTDKTVAALFLPLTLTHSSTHTQALQWNARTADMAFYSYRLLSYCSICWLFTCGKRVFGDAHWFVCGHIAFVCMSASIIHPVATRVCLCGRATVYLCLIFAALSITLFYQYVTTMMMMLHDFCHCVVIPSLSLSLTLSVFLLEALLTYTRTRSVAKPIRLCVCVCDAEFKYSNLLRPIRWIYYYHRAVCFCCYLHFHPQIYFRFFTVLGLSDQHFYHNFSASHSHQPIDRPTQNYLQSAACVVLVSLIVQSAQTICLVCVCVCTIRL